MSGASRVTSPYDHFDNPYRRAVMIDVSTLTASTTPLDLVELLGDGVPVTGIMSLQDNLTETLTGLYFVDKPTTKVDIWLFRGMLYPFHLVGLDIETLPTEDLVIFG